MKIRKKVEVIILRGGKVCLIKNVLKDGFVFYGFPGGGVEEGDTAVETCRKECLEEVGIAVTNIRSLGVTRRFPPVFVKAGRSDQYDGIDITNYVATFSHEDMSLYGTDHDQAKALWYDVDPAIKLLSGNTKAPLAVIVKGNPLYLERNRELADKFYQEVSGILEGKGYVVEFDEGEPHTTPNVQADIWISHSRGEDRLQFAPKDVKTLKLVTKAYDGDNPLHYELNPEDCNRLQSLDLKSKYDFGGFRVEAMGMLNDMMKVYGSQLKGFHVHTSSSVNGSTKWL